LKYTYIAVNSKNRKYKGEMTANSRDEVRKNLRSRGLTALSVTQLQDPAEINAGKSIWERELNIKDIHDTKIRKKRMLAMMHQMGLMMKAGISLSMAMEVMVDTESDKNLRKVLTEITKELYNGVPLSAAMSRFKTFPHIVINIIQAGEANGRLDLSFAQCASILEKEIALFGKIKTALAYPAFLLGLTIILMIVLSVLVIPSFSTLFSSFGAELPAITQFTVGVSNMLINHWYIILLIIAALVFGLRCLYKYNESFCMWWSRTQLKLPLIGKVMRISHIARFCRIMATLTDAGIRIIKALELARDVIANAYMKDCMNQIIEDVKIGTPINVAMSRYPVFDALLVSMIRVGEESGMLSDSLRKMTDMYEQQADESTKRLTGAITPVLTVLIAIVVATVVISIVVPMFGMYDVIATSVNS